MAKGGEAVARDASGRTVFVADALPGETVSVELTAEKKRFARARTVEVLEPSPDRVESTCAAVAAGCGGCDLRHATPDAQRRYKAQIVVDALERIGRLTNVPEVEVLALGDEGYRTNVRAAVVDGRAGYRMRNANDVVVPDACPVAHPMVGELLVEGRFGSADEVVLRAGTRTGERLALLSPSAAHALLPDDVRVVGSDELRAGRRAWFHENAAGRPWRISATSFFQSRPDGADALVELVGEMAAEVVRLDGDTHVVDLYAGVGLFAGTVGAECRVTAVERSDSSIADARVNLADQIEADRATVVRAKVEKWSPAPADLVIADPSRQGLGADAVNVIARTAAPTVVLVSCDPAALGRDAQLLAEAGYHLDRITALDLFTQTSHIETVARFRR